MAVVVTLFVGVGIGFAGGRAGDSESAATVTVTSSPEPLPAELVTVEAAGEPALEETPEVVEATVEPKPTEYNAIQVGDTGGFTLVSDVTLRRDSIGDFEGSFDMRNDSDEALVDYFKLIVLDGNRIVAEIDCGDYETVGAGRIKTMLCVTDKNFVEGRYQFEIEYYA